MLRIPALAVLALHGLCLGQSCLTSTFVGTTNATIGGAVYFDLTVAASNGITLTSLGLNLHGVAVGTPVGCQMWARFGSTHVSNELLGGWVFLGNGTGTMTASGTATTMTFGNPIAFPAGVNGVAVVATGGAGHRYVNGNGTNQLFADANVSWSLGSATNVPFTAAVLTPRVANATLCYNVGGNASYAWFTASSSAGVAPHTVTFTDGSFTSAPGGVQQWRWDFDGDSVIDVQGSTPTEQNPTWIYPTPGLYSVRLEIVDAFGTTSRTRTGLVRVAGTTNNTASADVLHFTFDEPPRPGNLRVFNAASSLLAPTFATASNDGWQLDPQRPAFQTAEAGYGCLGEAGVISRNHVNTGWPMLAQDMTIAWWHRIGTFGAGTANAFAYVFGGNGNVRCFVEGAAGLGRMRYAGTAVGDFTSVTDVKTGRAGVWTHMALVVDNAAGTASWYVDGVLDASTSFTPGAHLATNPELLVGRHNGTQNYSLFYSMDDFRLYSRPLTAGEIATLASGTQAATTTNYGVGCAGTLPSAPRAGSDGGAPQIGNTAYNVTVSGAEPLSIGLTLFGIYQNQFSTGGGPLPFDISFLGLGFAAGCNLEVGEVLGTPLTVTSATGTASVALAIPAVPSLAGSHFYAQWANLGTTSTLSDAVHICVR
ncbi:MAG: PKD domain-containing protein [Planctomycetes bacterium]|jgi:PKD repeat protein|nr:PKD domain-containing protein [Planctomycetota bacterium]